MELRAFRSAPLFVTGQGLPLLADAIPVHGEQQTADAELRLTQMKLIRSVFADPLFDDAVSRNEPLPAMVGRDPPAWRTPATAIWRSNLAASGKIAPRASAGIM